MTSAAPSRTDANSLSSPLAAVAVTALFGVNGMLLGGYGASLPSLRDRLGIVDAQIAVMLLLAALFAIISMQVGGRLADAIGARTIALVTLPILIVAAVVIAFAPTYGIAILGACLLGLGNGAMDVSMNAIGVQVERLRRKPIMSFFHAFFSIGNFLGAGAVLLISRIFGLTGGSIVLPVLLTLSGIAIVVLAALIKITPAAELVEHKVDGRRTAIPRLAWLLAIIALGFGLSEGTAVDWSSIHVTDVAHVDTATGSLGLIAVSAFMVVIRLVGDRLVARFGRRTVVRFGGVCAAAGYLMVIIFSPLPILVVGWSLVGFGVGMIAPQVYAVAGHIGGGRVLAVVVTFGYAAFLMGPAVIGFLVHQFGIQYAMVMPAVLCVVIATLAGVMPKTDSDLAPQK